MFKKQIIMVGVIFAILVNFSFAGEYKKRKSGDENKHLRSISPVETVKISGISIILGCPTDKSVVLNILSEKNVEGYIEYGTSPGKYLNKTNAFKIESGEPKEITLNNLNHNTQYYYRFKNSGGQQEEHCFHTQRMAGSTFSFGVQGDSHPERRFQCDPELYKRTMLNVSQTKPDFYFTMGDDFSVDTLKTVNAQTVAERYILQRPFLGLIGTSIFLVNGNHEQEGLCNLDGTQNNIAVLAANARNLYYPEPVPDSFYSGDAEDVKFIGKLRDYYAWTWGDALFVVIDPYWHSKEAVDNIFGSREKRQNMWAVTLGDVQYQWLKKTLEQSKAKYKFVFSHHVLGTGRGGIEEAGLYEWGGNNKRGEWEFNQRRPGWEMPIHKLFIKTGVTIFFQGHDHIFVKQELDEIVYQTLPDPANAQYTASNEDRYFSGVKMTGSGFLNVTVLPANVKVEYIRSYLPQDETAQNKNGKVAYSYTVKGK